MKRLVSILLGALLLALALATGTLVFLAQTEDGTRFLARQAERLMPIRFEEVSGTLWRALHAGRVTIDVADRRIEMEQVSVVADMLPLLFDNRLKLEVVVAERVTVSAVDASVERGPAARLTLPFMPIDIDLDQLVIEHLQIADGPPTRVAGSATWSGAGVLVRTLTIRSELLEAELTGELGGGSDPTLSAVVRWSRPGTPWSGRGSLKGVASRLEVEHDLTGPVAARAVGSASLAIPTAPAVHLDVALDDLQVGETVVSRIAGTLSGSLDSLTGEATAIVSTPAVAPFHLEVAAYGPVDGPLTLRNVVADALEGRIDAQGSLAWRDGVRLFLGGTAADVSLAALREELDGRASAAFQFRFENGRADLELAQLTGTLNGLQVEGELTLAQVAEGWQVEPLRLQVGDNRLEGTLRLQGAELDLDATIAAPGLGAFGYPVAGDAVGNVRLRGTWPELNGTIDLKAGRLELAGNRLTQAVVAADLENGVLQAVLKAVRAERDDLGLSAPELTMTGPLEDLAWQLHWADGDATGRLHRPDDGFLFRVEAARVRVRDRSWALQDATQLRVAGGVVQLAPACIVGHGAHACVDEFRYAAGQIETKGRLEKAPVALLQPWLPIPLAEHGFVEGSWSLAGRTGDLQGDLTLAARRLSYLPGQDQVIDLPDVRADGVVAGDVLQVRLAATGDGFTLSGEGSLAPLARDGRLSGVIDAAATDLAPLRVFAQRIEALSGSLSGRLQISGTLEQPTAEGSVQIVDGKLVLNDPDLELDEMSVRVSLDDSGAFDLRGTATQRASAVLLTGSGTGLFGGDLAFEAALSASNLKVEHPDWDVRLSPDLTMAYADGRGRVRGQVEVPRAEVRLTSLPASMPSPSDDVVVVGREERAGAATNPIRVDVDLVLGDDVTLKAAGIVADLQGRVRARINEQGRATLRGTLDVTGGVLAAQGQTLKIESGTVVYNGPVTKPYIDLRAARTIDSVEPPVKAGLHIRGNADNLTSSVFSEPAMADTRALSFLVLGRDIDQETEGADSGQLVAAAINLGLSRSKNITSELMRRAGLDELSASAEAENSFAIVAGKRVTDQLYVRYTYNTLSALGAFLVRYDLGRRWQLEAQSGEQSAMDLMYRFEK